MKDQENDGQNRMAQTHANDLVLFSGPAIWSVKFSPLPPPPVSSHEHFGYSLASKASQFAPFNQGRSRILFLFVLFVCFFFFGGGGIKLLNSRSDVILPHKKFTWADFGEYKYPYTPVATPLPLIRSPQPQPIVDICSLLKALS